MERCFYVGKTRDLVASGITVTTVAGAEIVIFFNDGCFYALDNLCPHQQAPLAEGGFVTEDGKAWIYCPWHHFLFDPATGQCDRAGFDTRAYTVEVVKDTLYLEFPG